MTPGCTSWETGTAVTATTTVTKSRYVWSKENNGSHTSIMANFSMKPRVLGLMTKYTDSSWQMVWSAFWGTVVTLSTAEEMWFNSWQVQGVFPFQIFRMTFGTSHSHFPWLLPPHSVDANFLQLQVTHINLWLKLRMSEVAPPFPKYLYVFHSYIITLHLPLYLAIKYFSDYIIQPERSRLWFPMESLEFFNLLILPTALWAWGPLSL